MIADRMRDRGFEYAKIHDTRGRRVADSTPLRVAAMVLTLLACTAPLKTLATTLTQAIYVPIKQEHHWEEATGGVSVRGLEGLEGEEEGLRRIGGYVGDALVVGLDPTTEAADWSKQRTEIPTSWTETPPELNTLAANGR